VIHGKVHGDTRGIRLDLQHLAKNIPANVLVRSLNRTADAVKTAAGRELRSVYNLKVAAVRAQIGIIRASGTRLVAEVRASGKPIPLYKFAARGPNPSRGRGRVTVKVLRAGGRKVVTGKRDLVGQAFIATMPSGHTGVFQRTGGKAKGGKQAIRELYSISLPGAFTAARVVAAIRKVADDRFAREIETNLAFYATRGR